MSDFYIGWSDNNEDEHRPSRKFFFLFLALMLSLLVVFTFFQKGFVDSRYEYGTQKEFSGVLTSYPVNALQLDSAELLPLVGYGKMGVDQILREYLDSGSYTLTLRGTIISYKGKRFLELSDGNESIINVEKIEPVEVSKSQLGMVELNGEIIDPKCFFGVMKPGFGKVHKSCAIRCISGMMPPVFVTIEGGEYKDFYFLTEVEEFNRGNILQHVGAPLKIRGEASEIANWKSISLNNMSLELAFDNTITKCGPI